MAADSRMVQILREISAVTLESWNLLPSFPGWFSNRLPSAPSPFSSRHALFHSTPRQRNVNRISHSAISPRPLWRGQSHDWRQSPFSVVLAFWCSHAHISIIATTIIVLQVEHSAARYQEELNRWPRMEDAPHGTLVFYSPLAYNGLWSSLKPRYSRDGFRSWSLTKNIGCCRFT